MVLLAFSTVTLAALAMMVTNASRKKTPGADKSSATSPAKATSPSKVPKRKNLTELKITSSRPMIKSRYKFYIMQLRGSIEIISCERENTQGTDAFIHPLVQAISGEENPFKHLGVILVTQRRVSQENNTSRTNTTNTYPRRLIVRVVEGESTHESRLSLLKHFSEFMSKPENNRYGHSYVFDDSSDLTPANEQDLERVDNYLLDNAILTVMVNLFEDLDTGFYAEYQEVADDFFTGPNYPSVATSMLGYPNGLDGNGAFHGNFNPAEEE